MVIASDIEILVTETSLADLPGAAARQRSLAAGGGVKPVGHCVVLS